LRALPIGSDCGQMTGNAEVMPRADSQRRCPEIGFGEIAINLLETRLWIDSK
jgi:hypothetical protein